MSEKYNKWVKSLQRGDLVMLIESCSFSPGIFMNWNGDSNGYGYRAQYIWIPTWENDDKDYGDKSKTRWEVALDAIETDKSDNYGWLNRMTAVNNRAEQRFFPYPKKFLTKNQEKFINLIKQRI